MFLQQSLKKAFSRTVRKNAISIKEMTEPPCTRPIQPPTRAVILIILLIVIVIMAKMQHIFT